MRTVELGARRIHPYLLLKQVAAWLGPRPPRCAFCPGPATEGWMFDGMGRVHGLCPHCLERALGGPARADRA